MKVLISSSKIVKGCLKSKTNIVEFMVDASMLSESIEEFFGRESEDLKIKIALLHMDTDVRTDADTVYKNLRGVGLYNLESFMEGLFALNFPSPWSSLDLAYRGLRQGDLSVVEYARRFKLFVAKLELNLKGQVNKFLMGLKDPGLRSALYKQNLEDLEFDGLVRWAVSLTNNLKLERVNAGVGVATEWEGDETCLKMIEGEGFDSAYKIMGIPLGKYLKAAEDKGVKLRCFNCFGTGHGSLQCGLRMCKFCEKGTSQAQHYSLMCPRAPRNLAKFLEERDKKKAARYENQNVKCIADDFADYTFESDELSD